MKKKGIAPLIATVLIIGFAIALAVVILTWGQSFTEDLTEKTETASEEGTVCLQDVDIGIKSVCYDATDHEVEVQVENEKEDELSGLIFRVIYDDGTADVVESTAVTTGVIPLVGFGLDKYTMAPPNYVDPKVPNEIHVLPKITMPSGKEITCEKKAADEMIYSAC